MKNATHKSKSKKQDFKRLVLIIGAVLLIFSSMKGFAQGNVAFLKPAEQSDIYQGCHANRAVDGNISGLWGNISMSSTNQTNQPWWEVNLLDTYDISNIIIYNRTDCCPERLNNFTIRVSDQPIRGSKSGTIYNPGNQSTFTKEKSFRGNARGKYVNIQLNGNGILTLAEVQVFGSLFKKNTEKDLNLALGKKARQSSIYNYSNAQRANDGDTDGNWNNGSVMHTNGDSQPFWEVDLGSEYGIKSVQVYNRTDCCADRLSNFKIWVSDRPLENIQGNTEKYIFAEQGAAMETRYKDYAGRKVGRYVRIQLEGTQYLNLAEVKVFGQKLGTLSVEAFEQAVRYNATTFRNTNPYGGDPEVVKQERTNAVSEGFDFNRTVNKTDESFWKIGTEVSTSFDILGQGVDVSVSAEGGQTTTSSVTDSQGGNVAQSTSSTVTTEAKVPGGCVRYEFHKWIFKQTPIKYTLNGKTFSWYKNNGSPTYVGDVTVFVFPINEIPEMIISEDNWMEKLDFDQFYNNYIRYTVQE